MDILTTKKDAMLRTGVSKQTLNKLQRKGIIRFFDKSGMIRKNYDGTGSHGTGSQRGQKDKIYISEDDVQKIFHMLDRGEIKKPRPRRKRRKMAGLVLNTATQPLLPHVYDISHAEEKQPEQPEGVRTKHKYTRRVSRETVVTTPTVSRETSHVSRGTQFDLVGVTVLGVTISVRVSW